MSHIPFDISVTKGRITFINLNLYQCVYNIAITVMSAYLGQFSSAYFEIIINNKHYGPSLTVLRVCINYVEFVYYEVSLL